LSYKIGHTTIGKILRKLCITIWELRWIEISRGYQKYALLLKCLGAIDGEHVRIRKQNKNGSLFYNYNNFFSLVGRG
jgi:hypothetical protein